MKQINLNDPAKAKAYFDDKMSFTTGPAEVNHYIKDQFDFVLIDVRTAEDYAKEHAPGALNLPEGRWNSFAGLQKNKMNVLYCYSQQCHLAARAAVKFAGNGFPVMEMDGGFRAWKEYNLPVESHLEGEEKRPA